MEAVYEVEYFEKANGFCPFQEWLEVQDSGTQFKIMARLNRVRLGNFGDSRSVGNGVYELRVHYGPGYRIYYQIEGRKIVLIFCAGDKSTQKKDIQLAHKYAQED